MEVANTLAYFDTELVVAVKSFIVTAPLDGQAARYWQECSESSQSYKTFLCLQTI